MKRIISLVLAILMILSIGAPTLASDEAVEKAPVAEMQTEPEIIVEQEETAEPDATVDPEVITEPKDTEETETTIEPEMTTESESTEEPAENTESETITKPETITDTGDLSNEPETKPVDATEPTDEQELVATSGTCGANARWSLSNGTLTISGTGAMADYSVDIGEGFLLYTPWGKDVERIKEVIIGDGITSIGDFAFASCANLIKVTIPQNIKSIGKGAFLDCGLKNITIPDSVTAIGETSSSIFDGTFAGCRRLTNITIGGSVAIIGDFAFGSCSSLTRITIPNSVTAIGSSCFDGCSALSSVTINANKLKISYDKYGGPFADSGSAKGIKASFGSRVSRIPDYIFSGCKKLTSVSIPTSVTEIGISSFAGCKGLTSVNIPDSVKKIEDGAFDGCTGLANITIPASVISVGRNSLSGPRKITFLNPNCDIFVVAYDNFHGHSYYEPAFGENTILCGYTGSTAEAHAKRYGYNFISLGKVPTAKNGWITEKGQKYYYRNGKVLKGLWTIDGSKYYFSSGDGHMLTGLVRVDKSGHLCYFSAKTGQMLKGLVTVDKTGHKCYFSATTGYRLTGLVTTAKGVQRYFSAKNGYMMKNGRFNIGGGRTAVINAKGVVTRVIKT